MRFGLLGEHLSHSFSPQVHACFGDSDYQLCEVEANALEEFLQTREFVGLNVTIPYKKRVASLCAELSPSARQTGSVNTVLRRADGSLYGDNTDVGGFAWLLQRNGGIQPGEKALVLGTGGASSAVQAVLRQCGAQTVLVSRNGENNYVNYCRHKDAVLLVNATPVGMYPNNGETRIDLDALPNLRAVLDLVYNPLNTRLLLDARERGLRYENGLSMLVMQAKLAREVWTGEKIPDALAEKVLCKLEKQMRNIILIGMPGSGKTSIGKRLAEKMDREFYDSDAVLQERIGSIPEFLRTHGQAEFRKHESEVLAQLGKKSACVIATGGGCVTRAENEDFLRQNGVIVRIERPLHELCTEGRPLSSDLEALFAERDALYACFADLTVTNVGIGQTATMIMEAIG